MNNLDALWDPVKIGHVSVRNRVFLPAHNLSLSGEAYGAYLGARARGGVGFIVAGRTATMAPHHLGPDGAWPKEWIPEIVKTIMPSQREGCPVVVQMAAAGSNGKPRTDKIEAWGPLWAPSAIPSPLYRTIPKVMDHRDIRNLIRSFALSASVVKEAGADGVEIHAGHGYLLSAFLSPYWNRREDEYGGTVGRRSRLVTEIAEAIRHLCGPDFIVGLKLNTDEYLGNAGTEQDEAMNTLGIMEATNFFDYFCLSHADYHSLHHLISPSSSGLNAPLRDASRMARAIVRAKIPILIQGAVKDLATAAEIIRNQEADMVGLARAHIADPDLVIKAKSGRVAETRRCVGANQGCWGRLGQPVACTVNPLAGREASLPTPTIKSPRAKVLIVGGGPAGMKCAETAAVNGHAVTLWESAEELGGQLNFASKLPDWTSWANLVQDLTGALRRLSVDIRLNKPASVDDVMAFKADVVIVATGSTWTSDGFSTFRPDRDKIPRASGAHVTDVLSAIRSPESCGQNVVIVDDNGDYAPLGLARILSRTGRTVRVVTSDVNVGAQLQGTLDLPWIHPRTLEEGVEIIASSFLETIGATAVVVSDKRTKAETTIPADTVILSMMRQSNDSLYMELLAKGVQAERIGDCLAPRQVDDAIIEGLRAGNDVTQMAVTTDKDGGPVTGPH